MNPLPQRSHGACLRCRKRKKKCDETKPACQNCTNKNQTCPGYSRELRWSRKHETSKVFGSLGVLTSSPSQHTDPGLLNSPASSISGVSVSRMNQPGGLLPSSNETICQPDDYHWDEIHPWALPSTQATIDKEPEMFPPPFSSGESNIVQSSSQPPVDETSYRSLDTLPTISNLDTFDGESPEQYSTGKIETSSPSSFERSNSAISVFSPTREIESTSDHDETQTDRWRNLLNRYYGVDSKPPATLPDRTTSLVEYYFFECCVGLSVFDSEKNPFRSAISRVWQDSPLMYLTIQSVAGAHAYNCWPKFQGVAISTRTNAARLLREKMQDFQDDESSNTECLMSFLMLGITATWLDPADPGFQFLTGARSLMRSRLQRPAPNEAVRRNDQFFAGALMYWEGMTSWLLDEPYSPRHRNDSLTSSIGNLNNNHPRPLNCMPHPWGGTSPEIYILTAEIARLIKHVIRTGGEADSQELTTALRLEEELLSIDIPHESILIDCNAENTSKSDLIAVADANKHAALLQIYRFFPEILTRRLNRIASHGDDHHHGFKTWLRSNPTTNTATDIPITLLSLSLHILALLRSITDQSGTRCVQIMALSMAAYELRYLPPRGGGPHSSSSSSSSDIPAWEISQARRFVLQRFERLGSSYLLRPYNKVDQLLREVWTRNDLEDLDFDFDGGDDGDREMGSSRVGKENRTAGKNDKTFWYTVMLETDCVFVYA